MSLPRLIQAVKKTFLLSLGAVRSPHPWQSLRITAGAVLTAGALFIPHTAMADQFSEASPVASSVVPRLAAINPGSKTIRLVETERESLRMQWKDNGLNVTTMGLHGDKHNPYLQGTTRIDASGLHASVRISRNVIVNVSGAVGGPLTFTQAGRTVSAADQMAAQKTIEGLKTSLQQQGLWGLPTPKANNQILSSPASLPVTLQPTAASNQPAADPSARDWQWNVNDPVTLDSTVGKIRVNAGKEKIVVATLLKKDASRPHVQVLQIDSSGIDVATVVVPNSNGTGTKIHAWRDLKTGILRYNIDSNTPTTDEENAIKHAKESIAEMLVALKAQGVVTTQARRHIPIISHVRSDQRLTHYKPSNEYRNLPQSAFLPGKKPKTVYKFDRRTAEKQLIR